MELRASKKGASQEDEKDKREKEERNRDGRGVYVEDWHLAESGRSEMTRDLI